MSKVGSAIRRAALFAAVEQIGKKLGCRDALPDGTSMPVAFTIDATVRRSHLVESFSGNLNVGHSFTKSSSAACDQDHLLACFADILTPYDRNPRNHDVNSIAKCIKEFGWRQALRSLQAKTKGIGCSRDSPLFLHQNLRPKFEDR